MKTNKILAIFIAMSLVAALSLSSASAIGEDSQWAWDGTGNNAWVNSNIVDADWNGIADGQEDDDNDGILNKNDDDYEKTNENMTDADGDGIPNSEDEDYERDPSLEGEGNWNMWANTWSANWDQVKTLTQRKSEVRAKISTRNAWAVDWLMTAFNNKYKNMNQEEVKAKYELLIWKVDVAIEKIEASNLSEAKKMTYKNLFEYIRVQAEEVVEAEEVQ